MGIINKLKACFGNNKEEYKMALWKHEQIGYRLYSIGIAIEELKKDC